MIRKIIDSNIIAYQHENEKDGEYGFNSYAFINGKEALVIDATFPAQLKNVIRDLNKSEIQVVAILPSHYHPDHIQGISLLSDVDIYGTDESVQTMQKMKYSEEEINRLKPNKIVNDGGIIEFGDHSFKLIMVGGHSACSMFIIINDQYIHVGDSYMMLNSGIDCLPSVNLKGVQKHIKALELMQEYKDKVILMSHGSLTSELKELTKGIDERIKYFEAIIESDNTISAEEALKHTDGSYAHKEWRKFIK